MGYTIYEGICLNRFELLVQVWMEVDCFCYLPLLAKARMH